MYGSAVHTKPQEMKLVIAIVKLQRKALLCACDHRSNNDTVILNSASRYRYTSTTITHHSAFEFAQAEHFSV